MEDEVEYWFIEYINTEGNYRHTIVKAPYIWEAYDVRTKFEDTDEWSTILCVIQTKEEDFTYDFT